jgi:hypothetical protein
MRAQKLPAPRARADERPALRVDLLPREIEPLRADEQPDLGAAVAGERVGRRKAVREYEHRLPIASSVVNGRRPRRSKAAVTALLELDPARPRAATAWHDWAALRG